MHSNRFGDHPTIIVDLLNLFSPYSVLNFGSGQGGRGVVDQRRVHKIEKIKISIFLMSGLYCTRTGSVIILLSLLTSKTYFHRARCSILDQDRGWWIREEPIKSEEKKVPIFLISGLYCTRTGPVINLSRVGANTEARPPCNRISDFPKIIIFGYL